MSAEEQTDLFALARVPRRHVAFDTDAFGSRRCETTARQVDTFWCRVAALFDGKVVMEIAGCYGWRTRISELRRSPYNLNIKNKMYKQGRYTVSEYRLVAPASPDLGGAA